MTIKNSEQLLEAINKLENTEKTEENAHELEDLQEDAEGFITEAFRAKHGSAAVIKFESYEGGEAKCSVDGKVESVPINSEDDPQSEWGQLTAVMYEEQERNEEEYYGDDGEGDDAY